MEVKTKINDVLTNLLKLKPGEIREGVRLCDGIGVDSTEMVEAVIALEKAFSVKFGAKEITKFCALEDIEKVIKAKISS